MPLDNIKFSSVVTEMHYVYRKVESKFSCTAETKFFLKEGSEIQGVTGGTDQTSGGCSLC